MAEPVTTDAARIGALARLPSRIAFLGFGLIGGSIARALRAAGSASQLVAWTPSGTGPAIGREAGFLDEAAPDPATALGGAGLVVLAASPPAVLELLRRLGAENRDALALGALVTDVASTKRAITDAAEAQRLPFVGGHPMAGRETPGAAAASAGLFEGRPWVVVPTADAPEDGPGLVEALAIAVGARPVRMGAAEHDAAVAGISHLPLVVAAALVESVVLSDAGAADWPMAGSLAATGWADMTRLARGDAEMGAGILATNAAAVAERLRAYRSAIDAWLSELEASPASDQASDPASDPAAQVRLRARLEAAKSALEKPRRP